MALKRKKSTRLVEGDIDAERLVGFRTVRAPGRNGRVVTRKVQESLYDRQENTGPASDLLPDEGDGTQGNVDLYGDHAMGDALDPAPGPVPVVARRPTMRQSDYIRQFVDRIDAILDAMLDRESLEAADQTCRHCPGQKSAIWRCAECQLSTPMCRHCIRKAHWHTPFHRIEQWTGQYYRKAELWEVGTYILLPHRHESQLCESLEFQRTYLEEVEQRTDSQEQVELGRRFSSAGPEAQGPTPFDRPDYFADVPAPDPAIEILRDAEYEAYLDALRQSPEAETEEPEDEDECIDHEGEAEPILPYLPEADMPKKDHFNNSYVRILHSNGIHHRALVACNCPGGENIPLDLVAAQFLPASFKNIRTLFTMACLDAFRLSNLELKASAYQFYRWLQRCTDPVAPNRVLNLYNEFRRMSRLWRWTKKLRWAGFAGHNGRNASDVRPAELANFCPACPQVGINVADDWEADPNRFVYRRVLVADGNFKADHVRQKKPSADIWLSEGAGFVPKRTEYHGFLKEAIETSTKAPCETTFRAITNALQSSKACDVTGVVGIACARHGCYAPNALCDLFKGEQQKNVDFALMAAIRSTNVDPKQGVMLLYDIICQYIINLYRRLGHRIPDDLHIEAGIGMFHVHAHKEDCFFRYAPSLIPGAARVCGEIMESLWAALNVISPTVRTATLAHRAEMLDDHTSDSNHKKLLGMVQFLGGQYLTAVENKAIYHDLYRRATARIPHQMVQVWKHQIEKAERDRAKNIAVMDIYGADLGHDADIAGPVPAQTVPALSAADLWIKLELVVEEKQIEIRRKLRRYGHNMRPADHEELNSMRLALTTLLGEADAQRRLAGVEDATTRAPSTSVPDLDWADNDDDPTPPNPLAPPAIDDRVRNTQRPPQLVGPLPPEMLPLNLPSYTSTNSPHRHAEITARTKQAGCQLAALRELIVNKAFQYADVIRNAPRKSVKTKGRQTVAQISNQILYHSQVYAECRSRLQLLKADSHLFERLRELRKEDVYASTAFIDPNTPGSSRTRLSWIWYSVNRRLDVFLQPMDGAANARPETIGADAKSGVGAAGDNIADDVAEVENNSPAMLEYKRVHWLRARAQYSRWTEELTYLNYEMQWTVRFFEYKSQWWMNSIQRASAEGSPLSPGQSAYAARQSAFWRGLMTTAHQSFMGINQHYVRL